jgi:hypothetical protein
MKSKPQPQADMPPPRKPPGRSVAAGMGGDEEPKRKRGEVCIALVPKPTLAKK